jgi:anti-sigma factor RsiW
MANPSTRPVTDTDLHAWCDSCLTPERAAEVEAHLSIHAPDAARVATHARHRDALRTAFDTVLSEPVPQRMLDIVQLLRTV